VDHVSFFLDVHADFVAFLHHPSDFGFFELLEDICFELALVGEIARGRLVGYNEVAVRAVDHADFGALLPDDLGEVPAARLVAGGLEIVPRVLDFALPRLHGRVFILLD